MKIHARLVSIINYFFTLQGTDSSGASIITWIFHYSTLYLFQASLLKPSPKNKHSSKNQNAVLKLSPESSRSSSRNSSVSPRERTTSTSSKNSSNRASPPGSGNSSHNLNKKHASAAASPASKAKSDNKVRPLIPWSKRNMGPPKNCNGWAWVGEGFEQKVYLNVSY